MTIGIAIGAYAVLLGVAFYTIWRLHSRLSTYIQQNNANIREILSRIDKKQDKKEK